MKLLSKPAINAAKNLERSIEISEGKKLATKVDELRHLRQQEEANLKKFRDVTIKSVRAEIDAELNKRSALQTENRWLEDVKKSLQKPIDDKSEEFAKREQAMSDKEEEIKKMLADFAVHKDVVDLKWREYNNEKDSLVTQRNAVDELLRGVLELQKKAREEKRAAEALILKANTHSEQISNELLKREKDVATREVNTRLRSEHLDGVQDALNRRERGIIDREETLGRELKRIIE